MMRKRAETILTRAGYYRTWTDNNGEPPALVAALADFAAQNPGLNPADYGYDGIYSIPGWHEAYTQESRMITRQYQDVKKALRECYLNDVTDQHIIDASPQAYSGRLEIIMAGDKITLDYTSGQYQATEYRAAVAAVLNCAVWIAERERK